jgi:hypothetical protein
VTGRYGDAVDAARAAREGREAATQLPMTGDLSALTVIGPAFAAAQAAATVDVNFGDE